MYELKTKGPRKCTILFIDSKGAILFSRISYSDLERN